MAMEKCFVLRFGSRRGGEDYSPWRRKESRKRWRRRRSWDIGGRIVEVEPTPFLYTRAPDHYQQHAWSKRLNHTNAMKQAAHFSRKRQSVLEAMENVYYGVPGKVNTRHSGRTNLKKQVLRLLRKERLYKAKRGEYSFNLLMCPEH